MTATLLDQAQAFVDRMYVVDDSRLLNRVERSELAHGIARFMAEQFIAAERTAEKHPNLTVYHLAIDFVTKNFAGTKDEQSALAMKLMRFGSIAIRADFVGVKAKLKLAEARIAELEAELADANKRLNALRCAVRVGDGS